MRTRTIMFVTCVLAFTVFSKLATGQQVENAKRQSGGENKMTTPKTQQSEAPFACSLTALNAAERVHHRELTLKLRTGVTEIRELSEGYAFQLGGERNTIAMVAEWITLERLCCPFFTFELEIGSEPKPIWLRITGRPGVKEFMQSEFGIKQ